MAKTEIARRADLSLTTTHRLAHEVLDWGGLEMDEEGRYRLSRKILKLASASTEDLRIRELALPHLVDEGVNGHLFPPGDHVALAERVARILDLPEAERAAMGEASHAKAMHHSAQKTVDVFERLYRGATPAEVRELL